MDSRSCRCVRLSKAQPKLLKAFFVIVKLSHDKITLNSVLTFVGLSPYFRSFIIMLVLWFILECNSLVFKMFYLDFLIIFSQRQIVSSSISGNTLLLPYCFYTAISWFYHLNISWGAPFPLCLSGTMSLAFSLKSFWVFSSSHQFSITRLTMWSQNLHFYPDLFLLSETLNFQ